MNLKTLLAAALPAALLFGAANADAASANVAVPDEITGAWTYTSFGGTSYTNDGSSPDNFYLGANANNGNPGTQSGTANPGILTIDNAVTSMNVRGIYFQRGSSASTYYTLDGNNKILYRAQAAGSELMISATTENGVAQYAKIKNVYLGSGFGATKLASFGYVNGANYAKDTGILEFENVRVGVVDYSQGQRNATFDTTKLANAGAIVHQAGTLILSGDNVFYGGLSMGVTATASSPNLIIASGVNTIKGNISRISGTCSVTFTGGALSNGGENMTIGASVGVKLDTGGGTFNAADADISCAGVISGDNVLTKTGNGKLTLLNVNSHASTIVNEGTLEINGTAAKSGTGAITVNGGTLLFNNTASNQGTGANVINLGANSTLTVNSGSTVDAAKINQTGDNVTIGGAGNIVNDLNLSRNTTLTGGTYKRIAVLDGKTLTLQGTVTTTHNHGVYTGDVDAKIIFDDATFNGNVTVYEGTVLSGAGTINGNLVTEDATIEIGLSAGTINVTGGADLTGTRIQVEYTAGGVDVLNVGGAITIDGTILEFTDTSGFDLTPKLYEVFGANNGLSDTDTGNITIEGLDGFDYEWVAATGSGKALQITAIPEPSTYALLAGALVAGAALVSRRRKRA